MKICGSGGGGRGNFRFLGVPLYIAQINGAGRDKDGLFRRGDLGYHGGVAAAAAVTLVQADLKQVSALSDFICLILPDTISEAVRI